MFSQDKIEQHLRLIHSALRFSGSKTDAFNYIMHAHNRDERLGKALHYENGKTAEWTCYFTTLNIDWVFSIIHPLNWKEVIALYYLDKNHENCDKAIETDVNWVLFTLMIENRFIVSRKVCPELLAFIASRFQNKNVYNYESLSHLWKTNTEKIPFHLDNLKDYADGKKTPFTY